MIQVVTTKDFRKSTIIVARPKKKNIVVISKKEYNSWQETNYLLQSKTNSNALAHSINQLSDSTKNT